jgi:hypothetical protein
MTENSEAASVTRASIAAIDFRGLSLSNPWTYDRNDTRFARCRSSP